MDQTQNESGWMHSIKVTLGSLDHREVKSFISSIPSVPSKLRKPNEEAYSPKLVTIGPIHRGTSSHLLAMEEHKWRYMLALLHRTQNPVSTLDECGTVILGLDDAVRASYGGNIKYEPHELAKIMLLDGSFLLELLLRCGPQDMVPQIPNEDNHHGSSSDPILGHQEMLSSVLTDLTLLENQIPFFVLKTLARTLFPNVFTSQVDHLVADLTLSLFCYPLIRCPAVAHFLHLMHLSSIIDEGQKVKQAQQELKRCATRLRAAGVTIRPVDRHSKLVNLFGFDIRFLKGVLEIPPLHVVETTEVYLRNFIAWEQSRIGISRQFTSYALLLRGLICSLQDIETLVDNGVLVKDTKISNEDLLTLFGTITKGVDQMDSSYSKLCEDLNTYSAVNPLKKFPILIWHYCRLCVECMRYFCKRSYRILIRDHIPNVWKLIGIVVAAVLLVLTIMQTYFSARAK
ncbi:UPF0481 protein At3g47200-like [Gastrolobium bilobum]|uniref:UPF0481 protein At3g47200-like n=1 Tax=Gastrolobium bilobum TaxID=150636 RepID=UPI002AAFFE64|nr:UPF0481 protein At3g47200-like [Gastrolobium bilobum]